MSLPPNAQVSTNNLVSFVFFADRDTHWNTFEERDIQYTSLLNSVSLSAKRAKFLQIIQFPQMRKHSRSTNTKHTVQYISGKRHIFAERDIQYTSLSYSGSLSAKRASDYNEFGFHKCASNSKYLRHICCASNTHACPLL